jgi:hypothetical protein
MRLCEGRGLGIIVVVNLLGLVVGRVLRGRSWRRCGI